MTGDVKRLSPEPDISVVVPTFDDGFYLSRCLSSIAAQSLVPLEVIVIDDGSVRADALAGIEQARAHHPGVRFVRQANMGPAAARNAGLALCRGRFVAFVDADDELTVDSLAGRRALLADEGLVASYCAARFVEPDGRSWHSSWRTARAPLDRDRIGDRDGLPGFLWCYLLSVVTLRAAGGLDTRLRIMEDFDMLARLDGLVVGSDEIGYVQHRRQGSLARGSVWRQMAGALRFLAHARRRRYFSRRELIRRYVRVPVAAAKVALVYRLRRARTS